MYAKLNNKNLKYIKSYDEMASSAKSIHNQPLERTIDDLQSNLNPNNIVNFCNKTGTDKLLRMSPWGLGSYPVPVAQNMATSEDKMADVRRKVHHQLSSLLLNTMAFVLATHEPLTYHVYSILLTNQNSVIQKKYNQVDFQDPINHKDSYSLMKKLLSLIKKQLYHQKLAGVHLITADIENPYHIFYDLHSHKFFKITGNVHRHVLLLSPRPLNLIKVSTLLNNDFYKIFGYQSIFQCKAINANIRPLINYSTKKPVTLTFQPKLNQKVSIFRSNLTMVKKMINYILQDYHLQTKDCIHGHSGSKYYPIQNKKELHFALKTAIASHSKYADVPFMAAPLTYRSMLVSAQLNSSNRYCLTKMSRAYLNKTNARATKAEKLELDRIHILNKATQPTITTVPKVFSVTSPALLENALAGNFEPFEEVYSATLVSASSAKVPTIAKHTQLSSSNDDGGLGKNQAPQFTQRQARWIMALKPT